MPVLSSESYPSISQRLEAGILPVDRGDLAALFLVWIAPPVDFMPFEELQLPEAPCLITLGSRDEIYSEASLRQWIVRQSGSTDRLQVVVLPGGDHFFGGQEAALERAIRGFLSRGSRYAPSWPAKNRIARLTTG